MNGHWTPLFYTKVGNDEHAFHVASADDKSIADALRGFFRSQMDHRPKDAARSWIVGSTGDRAYFGCWDYIKNVLGSNHPEAFDSSGRAKICFLGYTAPQGATLPKTDDIKKLDGLVASEVERLFGAIHQARGQVKNPVPAQLPNFQPSGSGHAWDEAVHQIEAKSGKCAFLHEGGGKYSFSKAEQVIAKAKPLSEVAESLLSKRGMIASGVGLCAVIGLGTWLLLRNDKAETKDRSR